MRAFFTTLFYFWQTSFAQTLPGFKSLEVSITAIKNHFFLKNLSLFKVTQSNGDKSCLFVSTTKLWPYSSETAENALNQAELVCSVASLQFAEITSSEEAKALREITSKSFSKIASKIRKLKILFFHKDVK